MAMRRCMAANGSFMIEQVRKKNCTAQSIVIPERFENVAHDHWDHFVVSHRS